MNLISLTDGTEIGFSPLFDKPEFDFIEGEITESAMGNIPDIKIVVKANKIDAKIGDEHTLKVNYFNGKSVSAKIYIYKIDKSDGNLFTICFLGCNSKFLRNWQSKKYNNINNAIRGLYQGNIEKNTESDLTTSNLELFQFNTSDYKYCTKLLTAYKIKSVFAYTIGGVRITDLTKKDYKMTTGHNCELKLQSPIEYSVSKIYGEDVKFVDYSDKGDFCYVKYGESMVPVENRYKQLIKNYIGNQVLTDSQGISNYSTTRLLPLEITDMVKFENFEGASENMYLSSRTITFSKMALKVNYTFKTINPFKEK